MLAARMYEFNKPLVLEDFKVPEIESSSRFSDLKPRRIR
jgi:hypothetical protein